MKKMAAVCSALAILCASAPAMPASADTEINEERFFVAVGSFGGEDTLLRYFDFNADSVEKVVLAVPPDTYKYGEVLAAYDDISMTRVQSAPDSPAYAMAYHYELDADTLLTPVGNCANYMAAKTLTVTDKTYDGSSHWSIRFADQDGEEYDYGLNTLFASYDVDPLQYEVGDTCKFAYNHGKLIVPLAEKTAVPDPPAKAPVLGDLDGDFELTAADAALLQDYLLGKPVTFSGTYADLNRDQVINAKDLTLLKCKLNPGVPAADCYTVNLTLMPAENAPLTRVVASTDNWSTEFTAPEGGWTENTAIRIEIPVDYQAITAQLTADSSNDPAYVIPLTLDIYQDFGKMGEQLCASSEIAVYPAHMSSGKISYRTSLSMGFSGSNGTFSVKTTSAVNP